MSKIQKAIRDIEKQSSAESKSATPVGKVVPDSEPVADSLGDETRQMAALDSRKVRHKIQFDREALRDAGFLAPENEERVLVDEYRQIKRPLIAHAFGKRATKIQDGHLILVSSALAGDGKTFTCINLALSIAREQDRSVLLIDADVAKAHITRLFGAEESPGLLDLLEDESALDLDDTVLQTDIPGLSVMAAGAMRPYASELLASDRMESLIRALGAQDANRIVLFDSSPLLATSEAHVLSTLVGQVVLVVAAEKTPQNAVLEAVGLVDEDKAINFVLNQARHTSGGGYYGYGYGYGDREGNSD